MDGDGVLQRSVPLYDGGLVIRLDEQVRALAGLQLQPAETHFVNASHALDKHIGCKGHDPPHLDDMLLAGLVLGGPLH